jgi:DNA-binding response OmpR family regulator
MVPYLPKLGLYVTFLSAPNVSAHLGMEARAVREKTKCLFQYQELSYRDRFYRIFTTRQPLPVPPSVVSKVKDSMSHIGFAQTAANSPYRYQDPHLEVDFARKYVALDMNRLVLTRKEYDLLQLLVQNAGEIVPRHALLMNVWGYSNEIRTRTLDVHIRRLRKKLGMYSEQYIETIFGIGYRFQPFRLTQRFPTGYQVSPLAVGA